LNTQYPIYIPSKQRSECVLTAKILSKEGIKFFVVIEPQDYADYAKVFHKDQLLVMDENNKGISYVRSWIKKHSLSNTNSYHWQADDNIASFKIRRGGKNIDTKAMPLFSEMEQFVGAHLNIGIAGMKHQMFAFAASSDISINKICYSCVLVNNQVAADWRPDVIEDTDYTLQVLSRGFCSVVFNRLIMAKVASMKMKGGNTDTTYAGDGRLKRAQGLQKYWPNQFKIREKYGKIGIAPSQVWKKFTQTLIRK